MAGERQRDIEIRSYRTVFDLERRLYRIDRLRLNPGGIPVRGVAYTLVLLLGVTALSRLPLAGTLAGVAPWYVRDVAVPVALAALLTVIRIEGRPFHSAVAALVSFGWHPRHLIGLTSPRRPARCWRPGDLVLVADGSHGALRRMRLVGPGVLLVRRAHERIVWADGPLARVARSPLLTIAGLAHEGTFGTPEVIDLAPGVRATVRPARGRCARR